MHKPFLQFFTHDIFMLLVNVKIEILEDTTESLQRLSMCLTFLLRCLNRLEPAHPSTGIEKFRVSRECSQMGNRNSFASPTLCGCAV